MEAFWRKGFEATSMADLCACTGLHKGSLYQAFGDKHQLFMQALEHYSRTEFDHVSAVLSAENTPLENLRAVVDRICADQIDGKIGCLMVNSMVELAPHDPEVRALLDRERELRERTMTDMIRAAQASGEIRAELDAERLALQVMVTMAGVAATIKAFLTADAARQMLGELIDSWT